MKPEVTLHRAVAAYLRLALRPPVLWTCFPAGGGGKARGGQLKAMGLMPGWPDILVLHNPMDGLGHFGAGPRVVGIELKSAKGVQSAEQKNVQAAFKSCRAAYAIARRVEDVEVILRQNDVPLYASIIGSPVMNGAISNQRKARQS